MCAGLTLPPPPAPVNSDRSFDRVQFQAIQDSLGIEFTIDGASNTSGDNAMCACFAGTFFL
jgi:hypothetical protein